MSMIKVHIFAKSLYYFTLFRKKSPLIHHRGYESSQIIIVHQQIKQLNMNRKSIDMFRFNKYYSTKYSKLFFQNLEVNNPKEIYITGAYMNINIKKFQKT